MQSHRFSWFLEKGAVPKNMCVLHKCDNPSCCNPNHLFLGTNMDNVKDRVKKGRSSGGTPFHKNKLKTIEFIKNLNKK